MIICGPVSLEIILALRETISESYVAFAGWFVIYFYFLNVFNKKGIAAKFKRTLALKNLIFSFPFLQWLTDNCLANAFKFHSLKMCYLVYLLGGHQFHNIA